MRTGSIRRLPGRIIASIGAVVLVGAGLVLTAGVAGATTLTISGSMEGNLPIHPGDTLKAGYDFTVPGGPPAADTVSVTNGTVVVYAQCQNGTSSPLTISLPNQSYTVPQGDGGDWFPSGDQQSSLVYQGSITVPSTFCGGQQGHAPQGATFTANFTANLSTGLNVRFHYSDNTSGSWSGTASVTPSPTPPPASIQLTKQVCALVNGSDCTSPGSVYASSVTVSPGTSVLFMIVITNTGGVTLTNVTVNDAVIPDCGGPVVSSLAAGATTQYFCGQTRAEKTFTNTASATGTTPSGTTVTSPTSSATVTVN